MNNSRPASEERQLFYRVWGDPSFSGQAQGVETRMLINHIERYHPESDAEVNGYSHLTILRLYEALHTRDDGKRWLFDNPISGWSDAWHLMAPGTMTNITMRRWLDIMHGNRPQRIRDWVSKEVPWFIEFFETHHRVLLLSDFSHIEYLCTPEVMMNRYPEDQEKVEEWAKEDTWLAREWIYDNRPELLRLPLDWAIRMVLR